MSTVITPQIIKKQWFNLNPKILLILLIIITFDLASVIYIYVQVQKLYSDQISTCSLRLAKAKINKLDTNNLNCTQKSIQLSDLYQKIDYPDIEKNNIEILKQEKALQEKTQSLNDQITKTQNQIKVLESSYIVQDETNSEILVDKILRQESYLTVLQQLLNDSKTKIPTTLENYTGMYKYLDGSELENAKMFAKNYTSYDEIKQIENYPNLIQKLKNLQKYISDYTLQNPDKLDISKFKIYTGLNFQNLYESINYKDQRSIITPVSITGDPKVDKYIVEIAEKRGYKLRSQADESNLVNIDGYMLESQVKNSFEAMKKAAELEGVKLGLVSGYRSVNDQRKLFMSKFEETSKLKNGRIFTSEETIQGKADTVLDSVLKTTAIPGYSRHHTGYTIDINDTRAKKDFTLFKDTPTYTWISNNNFLNAKRFGFIPSYPNGQIQAGPNPEEWEFVWVGLDKLLFD